MGQRVDPGEKVCGSLVVLPSPQKNAFVSEDIGSLAVNILDNGKYPLNLGDIFRSAQNRFPDRVAKAKGEGHGGVSKWTVKAGKAAEKAEN